MDPYSAVFNEYLDPLYLEDDYEVPQFDVQYTQPQINYYTFKPAKTPSPIKPNENKENEVNITETETQPQTLQLQQIPDLDFLDDSFTAQISELPNCDFEKFLSNISEENLNSMAEQNAKFHSRFVTNDENERATFIEQRENSNTIRKMNSAVKTFQQYLINVKAEFREIHTMQPHELDQYLQEFFVGIRKEVKVKNNNDIQEIEREYQPGSLDGFQSMINKHLKMKEYPLDIMRDDQFKKSRDCLTAKKKHLKQLGLGNHPNAAEALESEDEEELYRSGGFGTDDPDSLLSTIWYMNTIHFGLRGSHEHRQLKWGDLKLETDRNENQCLSYNERLTKTRDGSNTKNTRAYAPKSWSNPEDERKCHISTYLKYRSNRPTETCQPDSPFYLGVNRSDNAKHWYKNQPLGEKSLKNLMKQAVAKSNVEKNKKLTNHSGRKTAITRLLDEGVPITSVQQHTGHKSVQSLNNYAKNSLKTQKKMSSILCRNISSTCTSTNTNECTVSTLTAQPACPNEQQTAPVSSCNKPCRPYTATNENETAVLPIQDKTVFNVQNNGQNVADNMDSSNTNTCNNNNNFQQKMKNSSQMNYNQLFPAGTIIQGGTFNMYFGQNPQMAQPDKENDPSYSKPLKRKRKFVIESDSDDE
ncbi:uncharacterized protein [Mytilus edulis]|uniref:uncharacterized protein n=1 Tax=Mytilus edulis TaxID=6550 RepID=UPI0039EFA545